MGNPSISDIDVGHPYGINLRWQSSSELANEDARSWVQHVTSRPLTIVPSSLHNRFYRLRYSPIGTDIRAVNLSVQHLMLLKSNGKTVQMVRTSDC